MSLKIDLYQPSDHDLVVALSMRAWAPVFEKLEPAVPSYVYQAFYPQGWQVRQTDDIADFLTANGQDVLVARQGAAIVGWVGLRLHPEDGMGEIYILAVDPQAQRGGVAKALMEAAMAKFRAAGMSMAMVETGGDPGHAPSRATYENFGFEPWPVARYFREL
ncbi:GNAT family N-acetyltransferase [Phenylobacterium sp.]|uniref:GNAT family N-acetyltransferase n=1 Tax=Phenylobacterium sp. TaxID=1871053 RepID=UPI0030F3E191